MTMMIIDLFEEINIHHDKNQVAMIDLAWVAGPNALIVSQHLLGFGRKNFFQISPVPDSGEKVGERDFP